MSVFVGLFGLFSPFLRGLFALNSAFESQYKCFLNEIGKDLPMLVHPLS